jgi:hypothetical protein
MPEPIEDPAPTPQLDVSVGPDADGVVIRVVGTLDRLGGRLLDDVIARLNLTRNDQVRLDLFGVRSADLGGVRALAAVRAMIELAGAELTIDIARADIFPIDWHEIALEAPAQ